MMPEEESTPEMLGRGAGQRKMKMRKHKIQVEDTTTFRARTRGQQADCDNWRIAPWLLPYQCTP